MFTLEMLYAVLPLLGALIFCAFAAYDVAKKEATILSSAIYVILLLVCLGLGIYLIGTTAPSNGEPMNASQTTDSLVVGQAYEVLWRAEDNSNNAVVGEIGTKPKQGKIFITGKDKVNFPDRFVVGKNGEYYAILQFQPPILLPPKQ